MLESLDVEGIQGFDDVALSKVGLATNLKSIALPGMTEATESGLSTFCQGIRPCTAMTNGASLAIGADTMQSSTLGSEYCLVISRFLRKVF